MKVRVEQEQSRGLSAGAGVEPTTQSPREFFGSLRFKRGSLPPVSVQEALEAVSAMSKRPGALHHWHRNEVPVLVQ